MSEADPREGARIGRGEVCYTGVNDRQTIIAEGSSMGRRGPKPIRKNVIELQYLCQCFRREAPRLSGRKLQDDPKYGNQVWLFIRISLCSQEARCDVPSFPCAPGIAR